MSDFFTPEERAALFKKSKKKVKLVSEVKYNFVVNFIDGDLFSSKYIAGVLLPCNVITIKDYKTSLNLYARFDFSAFKNLLSLPVFDSLKDVIIKNTSLVSSGEGLAKDLVFPLSSLIGKFYGPELKNPLPVSIYFPDGRVFLNQEFSDTVLSLHSYNAIKILLDRKQLK